MAENLTQYKAGAELLSLLRQHGLPKDALNAITNKVADIVQEALQAGKHPGPGGQQIQQQMQRCSSISAATAFN